jgi:hypothetical protein
VLTLGLTSGERRAFEEALRASHTRKVEVDVLDLNGKVLSSISSVILDGQVNVDADAEVSRSLTLSFLDPAHALNFDTDSPDDGAVYADRMLRVRYGVHVEKLGRYVWVPVFEGPVTGLSRDGAVVQVEAQGKEALVKGAVWKPLTLKKGMSVVGALRTLMEQRGGETKFNTPSALNAAGKHITLPKTISLVRLSNIWTNAKRLARSINRQLFYNGAGVLVLREWPSAVAFTFTQGDGGAIISEPSIKYELGEIVNVVEVNGQPPAGKKGAIHAVAIAPRSHPLNPVRLGRTNAPRYLVEVVDDSDIRSDAGALRVAKRTLEDRLLEAVEVSFDSLPIPHLDPGDKVRLRTDSFSVTFRLRKFSIPLAPSGAPAMSVGYLKRLTPTRRQRKRKGSK